MKDKYNQITTPHELLDFMATNLTYGYLSKNGTIYHLEDQNFDSNWYQEYVLESQEDFLNTQVGNCWDQVEFERQWFEDHCYEVKTFFEIVNLTYENPYPTHAFLVFKDIDDSWNWFENSDGENRGIHKFVTLDACLAYQYQCYLQLLDSYDMTEQEKQSIMITEYQKPAAGISAKEYLAFVLDNPAVTVRN